MDLCEIGSVKDLILASKKKTLSEEQISFITLQALKGLLYLHSQNIIHRDVKTANILMNFRYEVKIGEASNLRCSHEPYQPILEYLRSWKTTKQRA
jgi:serine/threonine protein kinase